jgi:ribosomal 50S subunit-recycling heat shock protein
VVKVVADTKVTVNGKDAKATDLKPGDKVLITLKADESAALAIVSGTKVGDGEKPGVKNPKFGGKIASVDAATRTVTLAAKGEGGKEIVVKLTADAKIVVDGKEVKIDAIPKGALATVNLVSAKDGQPREANELTVAGLTFTGVIKQIDATTVTIGNEKTDRVVKLAAGGKVMIGEKEGKLADLKVGDKVQVTLTSDDSAATLIQSGGKKPAGDKPKPEKEDEEE